MTLAASLGPVAETRIQPGDTHLCPAGEREQIIVVVRGADLEVVGASSSEFERRVEGLVFLRHARTTQRTRNNGTTEYAELAVEIL